MSADILSALRGAGVTPARLFQPTILLKQLVGATHWVALWFHELEGRRTAPRPYKYE